MPIPNESDYPAGHPARADYDPASDVAKEYARKYIFPLGERDFAVDHPKALDTPGNTNHVEWVSGVDPSHPDLEQFTGRTAAQAEGARALYMLQKDKSAPTEGRTPTEAPPPPPPESAALPSGQPGR